MNAKERGRVRKRDVASPATASEKATFYGKGPALKVKWKK